MTANMEDRAYLDIAANGLWGGPFERTFVCECLTYMLHPIAMPPPPPLSSCYKRHEKMKKQANEKSVQEVEHTSFTPVILSAMGGMANEVTHFYKRMASNLAAKWDQHYSSTISWLRCLITFSLLRLAIQCLRGARSCDRHTQRSTPQ